MKIRYFIVISFLTIAGSAFFTGKILSQETNSAVNIQYPVQELGNCENETACRAYCDEPGNINACLNFAEKNNLMSGEELAQAKKFLSATDNAPGGCRNKKECDNYCNDINNIDECISFAERNGLIPEEELKEAKQVQSAIKRGVKPPPCKNKQQCDIYCEEADHMEECITFGVEAGFIQGKEAEDAQKMLQAIKRGVKPPPCRGREECEEYCSTPENMETCMTFAVEAGFMEGEEAQNAQKMLQAIKRGVKPPPCRGKEECDIYCTSENHIEECMNFAVAAGFMSEEDAKMARKTGGKGPGGCRGREECEAFCNNPENQETCFSFAKENGMIPEEELKMMEEGKQQFRQSLEQMPNEAVDCLQGKVGTEILEKMKSGEFMPGPEIGNQMQECFQMMGPPQGQGFEGGNAPPEMRQQGPGGPSGCQSPEECQKLCEANPEACQNFQGPQGQQDPQRQQYPNDNWQGAPQGQPCEGDACKFNMPPCEGENCQYAPTQQYQVSPGEFKPPEGELKQYEGVPGPDQQYQQQYEQQYQQQPQQYDQQLQQQQIQLQQQQLELQQQQLQLQQQQFQQPMPIQEYQPPAETAPPPPPPSAFFKIESSLGALLYPLARALFHLR
ncbi:MAG: hypothetical protein HYT36_02090 [Candidatus Staskawiczbacteria bacterium]|nr:hypothetical protein [Candidatus Staskawiczbacteria bacterium]